MLNSYQISVFDGKEIPESLINCIIAPMLNSLRYGNDLFKLIDKEAYFIKYPPYIKSIISRKDTKLKIAMLDKDTVLGWAMIEKHMLHYVWVKKEVRRQGIAKALIPKDCKSFSHITNYWANIWPKYQDLKFDPFV